MLHRKLSQQQAAKLRGLLHMEYTPGELAEELQCHRSYIRYAIAHGCPSRRDGNGHWWIVGDEFAAWYQAVIKRQKRSLEPGEAYCLRCRDVVQMPADYQVKQLNAKAEVIQGVCPRCGTVVNRFRRVEGQG